MGSGYSPRRGSISGAFAWRLIEMLESPTHRALSLSARRVLDRLEIELYRHGGKPEENGRLACTYDHFVEFGIERHAIGPAIREVVALGFVEVTRQGCAGNAGYRQPTWYRLTYRHAGSDKRTTDEWRKIETVEQADMIAKAARTPQPKRQHKNKSPVRETPTGASAGNPTNHSRSPVRETPTTGPVRETPTTSISREGTTDCSNARQTKRCRAAGALSLVRWGQPVTYRRQATQPRPSQADTPQLVATLVDYAPAVDDVLPSNALTPVATGPRLAWTKPIVRELFGEERRERLEEIEQADLGANKVACDREAGVLQ